MTKTNIIFAGLVSALVTGGGGYTVARKMRADPNEVMAPHRMALDAAARDAAKSWLVNRYFTNTSYLIQYGDYRDWDKFKAALQAAQDAHRTACLKFYDEYTCKREAEDIGNNAAKGLESL